MTGDMLTVFGVLAGAVVLFASGRVRPDVVAILVVLALNLSGVLTIQEALAGFGQPVVVLIAAVSIVGEGLITTGVTYRLGEAVMKAGGSNEARLVALVMVLAGTVGAFMSSSAIVAMFIPVVLAIAKQNRPEPQANVNAAFGSGAGQRDDDPDRVLAKHDCRGHSSGARPRSFRLF
jgi:di/tricarboxylate transporter